LNKQANRQGHRVSYRRTLDKVRWS
jgi:hypothetical protein